jgi:preprotein translocase subunit SecE
MANIEKKADPKPAVKKAADKKAADKKAADKKPAKAKKTFRLFQYFKEVYGEVKKLIWPTGKELVSRTGAVFAFLVGMAILIGLLDLIFTQGVSLIAKIGA